MNSKFNFIIKCLAFFNIFFVLFLISSISPKYLAAKSKSSLKPTKSFHRSIIKENFFSITSFTKRKNLRTSRKVPLNSRNLIAIWKNLTPASKCKNIPYFMEEVLSYEQAHGSKRKQFIDLLRSEFVGNDTHCLFLVHAWVLENKAEIQDSDIFHKLRYLYPFIEPEKESFRQDILNFYATILQARFKLKEINYTRLEKYCIHIQAESICNLIQFQNYVDSLIKQILTKSQGGVSKKDYEFIHRKIKKLLRKPIHDPNIKEKSSKKTQEKYRSIPFYYALAPKLSYQLYLLHLPLVATSIAKEQILYLKVHHSSIKSLEKNIPFYLVASNQYSEALQFVKDKKIKDMPHATLLDWSILGQDYKGVLHILKKSREEFDTNYAIMNIWLSCTTTGKVEKKVLKYLTLALKLNSRNSTSRVNYEGIKQASNFLLKMGGKYIYRAKRKSNEKLAYLGYCLQARAVQSILSFNPIRAGKIAENIMYIAQENEWLFLEYQATLLYGWAMLMQKKTYPARISFVKANSIPNKEISDLVFPYSRMLGLINIYNLKKSYTRAGRIMEAIYKKKNHDIENHSIAFLQYWLPHVAFQEKSYFNQLVFYANKTGTRGQKLLNNYKDINRRAKNQVYFESFADFFNNVQQDYRDTKFLYNRLYIREHWQKYEKKLAKTRHKSQALYPILLLPPLTK